MHDRRSYRRRHLRYLFQDRRRHFADGISSGSIYTWWYLFWSWRTFENASLIHNRQRFFDVSFLICMFQDSVPAGSYNDPFLSSVCVRHLTPPCLGLSLTFAFFECQQILKGLQQKVTSSCVSAYYIRFLLHKVPCYHFNKANPKGIYRAPGCPQLRFFVCLRYALLGWPLLLLEGQRKG